MHFSFLTSKSQEYCALRARNRSLALVWQAGHAALAMSPFCVFAAVVVVVTGKIIDPELGRDRSPWPIVGSLLFCTALLIGLGVSLMRYAVRKGRTTDEDR